MNYMIPLHDTSCVLSTDHRVFFDLTLTLISQFTRFISCQHWLIRPICETSYCDLDAFLDRFGTGYTLMVKVGRDTVPAEGQSQG